MSLHRGVVVALIVVGLPARADEKANPERPLKLTLTTTAKTVRAGEKPVFVLTIENRGSGAERLPNGQLPSLQATWYRLTVIRDGKPVEMTTKLIGVPVHQDGDVIILKPGEKVDFELSRFGPSVESLPPGRYEGRFRFSTRPERGEGAGYLSPPAEFVVEK